MFRLCRRLRVPFAGVLLMLLAAPAAAACCLDMTAPMPCCTHGDEGARLALPCCAVDADQAPASQPASSPMMRTDLNPALVAIPVSTTPLVVFDVLSRETDSDNGPPGNRLYIRLSVIRR